MNSVEDTIDQYREKRGDLVRNLVDTLGQPKEPVLTGIVVLTPWVVTGSVAYWLYDKVNLLPGADLFTITAVPFVNQVFRLIVFLVGAAFLVTGIGHIAQTRTGYEVEKRVDAVIDTVPVLGTLYNITKVATDTIIHGPQEFRTPVKIDFNGLRITALKTGNKAIDGRDILFIPTAPNITTGFVVEADPSRLEATDETVEDALTRILSAGFGSSTPQHTGTGEQDTAPYRGVSPDRIGQEG